ncbi:hypothetical protein BDW62DRAFT_44499 [Aspergillus aurantiobrunneus]
MQFIMECSVCRRHSHHGSYFQQINHNSPGKTRHDTQCKDSSPKGPITKFPAEGLRHARRFVTSHNKDGNGMFVDDDDGKHHRIMVEGLGVANIIYSTSENPVDLNHDADMIYARDNEPPIHVPNGSVARMIDFAPGVKSPLHRALSIDYGVVVEGKFELTLDSGEKRVMLPDLIEGACISGRTLMRPDQAGCCSCCWT